MQTNIRKLSFPITDDGLKNIFPFSMAIKCLHNLEYLVVCDCFKLREIVVKR